jgi:hypothetical protein
VERAFGVLQARFRIIKNPGRLWKTEDLSAIMITAVILHNMIIDNERDTPFHNNHDYHQANSSDGSALGTSSSEPDFQTFLLRYQAIRSRSTHRMLKDNLIEHLWTLRGQSPDDLGDSD